MSKKVCQEQKFFESAGVSTVNLSSVLSEAVTEKRVFITGFLNGESGVQFNGEPIEGLQGGRDIFVSSLNHCGTQQFFKIAGGLGSDQSNSVDADEKRVVVGGIFGSNSSDFNGTPLVPGFGGFVASLNHKGVQKFFKTGLSLESNVVKLNNGNIFVTGEVNGPDPTDFAGNAIAVSLDSDIFVAGLNKCGTQQFFKTAVGLFPDGSLDMIVTDRRIYLTGFISGSTATDFNGNFINEQGLFDAFVASLDHLGNQKFFVTAGSADNDISFTIDAHDGRVFVGGILSGSTATDFNGNLINLNNSATNVFLASLDKCGNQKFFKVAGNGVSFTEDYKYYVAADEHGIYLAGQLVGPSATNFNGEPLDISDDAFTVFIAGFDKYGNQKFFRTSSTNSTIYLAKALTVNENGVYLTSVFQESATGVDFMGIEVALEGSVAVAGFSHKGCQKFFVSGGVPSSDDDAISISNSNLKVIGNRLFVAADIPFQSGSTGVEFNGIEGNFSGNMFLARLDDLCLPTPVIAPFRSKIPVF